MVTPKLSAYDWQSPKSLAKLAHVQRLTIYRWIRAGIVERRYRSIRKIEVRLRSDVALPSKAITSIAVPRYVVRRKRFAPPKRGDRRRRAWRDSGTVR